MLVATAGAAAQSVDGARAARDKARAELTRAQDAFDRADEAYINALGGAAKAPVKGAPAPAATVSSVAPTILFRSPHGRVVTFSMAGPGADGVDPLDYRGRLIVDGEPAPWTQHASGAKNLVSADARALAYEIQTNSSRNAGKPSWTTICNGDLPEKNTVTVEVVIAQRTTCAVR